MFPVYNPLTPVLFSVSFFSFEGTLFISEECCFIQFLLRKQRTTICANIPKRPLSGPIELCCSSDEKLLVPGCQPVLQLTTWKSKQTSPCPLMSLLLLFCSSCRTRGLKLHWELNWFLKGSLKWKSLASSIWSLDVRLVTTVQHYLPQVKTSISCHHP